MQPIQVFNGLVETYTPGSFVAWEAQAPKSTPISGSDHVLGLVGRAAGGAPLHPFVFSDSVTADKVLVSGDLLDAVKVALATSVNGTRPRAVVAVNVLGGTQASYTILDSANAAFATVKTKSFREVANQAYLSISGNRTVGYSVAITDPITGMKIIVNRVGLGIYVQYTGSGTAATLSVTDVGGVRTLSTAVTGGQTGENLNIPLVGLTLRTLAQKIQSSGPYTVQLARDGNLLASLLDTTAAPATITGYATVATTTADAAAGATSLPVTNPLSRNLTMGETLRVRTPNGVIPVQTTAAVLSTASAIPVKAIGTLIPSGSNISESAVSPFVSFSAVKGDFDLLFTSPQAAALLDYTPGISALFPKAQAGAFVGGGSLPDAPGDWLVATKGAVDTTDFNNIVILTEDRGIAAGVRGYLQGLRSPAGGSRPVKMIDAVATSMLPLDNSDSQIQAYLTVVTTEVASINDRDGMLITQSSEGVSAVTGQRVRLTPIMTAVHVAATRAAIGAGNSLTYQTLSVTAPFPDLSAYKNAFTRAGSVVLTTPRRGAGARIELGRTTYVGDDNSIYESEKQVEIMNLIQREVRMLQDSLVPGQGSPARLADYKKELGAYYASKVSAGLIEAGVDATGARIPAYEFTVFNTRYQGRLVKTVSYVNPTPEFLVAEHRIIARPVEIEV